MNQVTSYNRGGVSKKEARVTVEDALRQRSRDISVLLGKEMSLERFLTAIGQAVVQEPRIATVPLEKIMLEVSKAAKDGLVLDGREATLLFFDTKNGPEVTYVPMILGLRKRAFKSGLVKSLVTGAVYEKEMLERRFKYVPTAPEPIMHEPLLDPVKTLGQIVAAYSLVRMADGETSAEVMRIDEINGIRARGRQRKFSPWDSDFSEMARKTVFRRHAKSLPLGDDFRQIVERVDDLYDDISDVPAEPTQPVKRSVKDKFKEPEPAAAVDDQPEAMEPHEQDQAGDIRDADDVF